MCDGSLTSQDKMPIPRKQETSVVNQVFKVGSIRRLVFQFYSLIHPQAQTAKDKLGLLYQILALR